MNYRHAIYKTTTVTIPILGYVRNSKPSLSDRAWGGVVSNIELNLDALEASSIRGLEEFSHVEVTFYFHRNDEEKICYGTRHPLDNSEIPEIGILAQRTRHRPSYLGSTICQILAVSEDTGTLTVSELDAVDGTPVLDIKPIISAFLPKGKIKEPNWVTEIMVGYWSKSKLDE